MSRMDNAKVKIQASDCEMLLVSEAGTYEALKHIAAGDSKRVARIVDRLGLQINLTAGAK